MSVAWGLAAALLCLLGSLLCYLSSPQQLLRRGRLPSWPGIACLLLSLPLFWRLLAPLEAVAAWCVLAMLAWSLLPFLGAWRARVRAGRAA